MLVKTFESDLAAVDSQRVIAQWSLGVLLCQRANEFCNLRDLRDVQD